MAADRAAELTEAYRILSDAGRRAEYDSLRQSELPAPAAPPPPSPPPSERAAPQAAPGPSAPQPSADERPSAGSPPTGPQFRQERAHRDTFVRKATVDRFRHALEAVGESYDEKKAAGFDLAFVPKSKLFGRSKNPRLLGRFVSAVDADAIADTWSQAAKWNASSSEEVCVFLMASSVSPPRQLAEAIAAQRRKPAKGGKVVLIPMDARNWDAHVPVDAPAIAKTLLTRLRAGG
jgi:curved DNA-binding protein CbpA